MVMIYAKLIILALAILILGQSEGKEISLYKAIDYYKERFVEIFNDLRNGTIGAMQELLQKVSIFAKKSVSKNRPGALYEAGLRPIEANP